MTFIAEKQTRLIEGPIDKGWIAKLELQFSKSKSKDRKSVV